MAEGFNGKSDALLDLADGVSALRNKVDDHGKQLSECREEIREVRSDLAQFAKGQTKASRFGAFLGAAIAGAVIATVNQCAPASVASPASAAQK